LAGGGVGSALALDPVAVGGSPVCGRFATDPFTNG
jgi:hypothetical protein